MQNVFRSVALLSAAIATGLLCATANAQVSRSNSLSHTQDPTTNTATATCSLGVDGIDPRLAFLGTIEIYFTGQADNNTRLLHVNYSVSPAARKFVDESTGAYRVEAKLTGTKVTVSAEATRGPLGFQISNKFTCNASLWYATAPSEYLHAFTGQDDFYGYGSTP